MARVLLVFAMALATACANGDLNDETPGTADALLQQKIVACESARLPRDGERCDPDDVSADAYCRLGSCNTRCEDECFCAPGGRWECRLYCRDEAGCGTTPLCGVGCAGTDAAVMKDTAVADTSDETETAP